MTNAIAPTASSLPAPAPGAVPMPVQPAAPATAATPNGASPATINGIPTSDPNGNAVVLTLPDGRQIKIPLATAVQLGIVTVDQQGNATLTPTGQAALQKIAADNPAAVGAPSASTPAADAQKGAQSTAAPAGSPAPPAGPELASVGSRNLAAPQQKTQTLPDGKPAPKQPSELLGKAASLAFMVRGILKIGIGPGMPSWQTAYFALNGINNNLAGGKMLPDWYKKGPIADLLEFALVGGMTHDALKATPGEWNKYQTALAAEHAAGKKGIGAHVRSLLVHEKAPPTPAPPDPIAKAAHDTTFLGKFAGLLTPLFHLGAGLSSISSILALGEYTKKHGTHGLLKTTTGRDAILGALGGVAMLGAVFLPASPLAAFSDLASDIFWIGQIANGKGWLDGMLGGDPEEPENDTTAVPAAPPTPAATPAPTAAAPPTPVATTPS